VPIAISEGTSELTQVRGCRDQERNAANIVTRIVMPIQIQKMTNSGLMLPTIAA
jgi:hypothetical protein